MTRHTATLVVGFGLVLLVFGARSSTSDAELAWKVCGVALLLLALTLLSRLLVRPGRKSRAAARWFAVGTVLEGAENLRPRGSSPGFPAVGTLRIGDDRTLVWEPRSSEVQRGFNPLRWPPGELPEIIASLTQHRDLLGWRYQRLTLPSPGGGLVVFAVTWPSSPLRDLRE